MLIKISDNIKMIDINDLNNRGFSQNQTDPVRFMNRDGSIVLFKDGDSLFIPHIYVCKNCCQYPDGIKCEAIDDVADLDAFLSFVKRNFRSVP